MFGRDSCTAAPAPLAACCSLLAAESGDNELDTTDLCCSRDLPMIVRAPPCCDPDAFEDSVAEPLGVGSTVLSSMPPLRTSSSAEEHRASTTSSTVITGTIYWPNISPKESPRSRSAERPCSSCTTGRSRFLSSQTPAGPACRNDACSTLSSREQNSSCSSIEVSSPAPGSHVLSLSRDQSNGKRNCSSERVPAAAPDPDM